ncbi:hypothetical protein L3X38_000653 [Prunus dulcis]|uniref:Mitochondrial protein n=1 Tax=Prunus dulcis TaxID=3755 RepID=A0AAD4ZJG9_PRUDU|nr:hypothetical protein L3X38_000653 [Prunus dulcis]
MAASDVVVTPNSKPLHSHSAVGSIPVSDIYRPLILTYQRRRSLHLDSSSLASTSLQSSGPIAIVPQPVSGKSLPITDPPMPSTTSPVAPQSFLAPPPSPPMRTQPQHSIVEPKIRTDGTVKYPISRAVLTVIETAKPTCYTQASKHEIWRATMVDEINALLKNNTWTLVPPSSSQNLVGCKWVFQVKHNPYGTIERHKDQLVAKDFINKV